MPEAGHPPAQAANRGSVRQSAIGYAASDNYQAGIGYWYGMGAHLDCDCGVGGDVTGNGALNPQEVTLWYNSSTCRTICGHNRQEVSREAKCSQSARFPDRNLEFRSFVNHGAE